MSNKKLEINVRGYQILGPDTLKYVYTSVGLLCLCFVLLCQSKCYFKKHLDTYTKPWVTADSLRKAEVTQTMGTNNSKTSTLFTQYLEIENLKSHHLMTAKDLYRNYYAFITTLTFFSVLLAACVFLILKNGWNTGASSIELKVFFVICSFLTTLLFGYIQVYNLDFNIAKNLEKYFVFEKMQIDIHSAFTCDAALGIKNEPADIRLSMRNQKLDSLILATNEAIKANRGLMINIDSKSIPNVLKEAEKFK
jgi:hypothetical protein